jgi:hypothetical protein
MIDDVIAPRPKLREDFAIEAQKPGGDRTCRWNASSETTRTLTVLDSQHALLEPGSQSSVALLGGLWRDVAGQLPKLQIRIGTLVGLHHHIVPGQHRGDCKLLLLVVAVGDRVSWPRLDEAA